MPASCVNYKPCLKQCAPRCTNCTPSRQAAQTTLQWHRIIRSALLFCVRDSIGMLLNEFTRQLPAPSAQSSLQQGR